MLLLSVNTSRAQTRAQVLALYRDVVLRLQAIPGVRAVAASGMTPIALGAASRFLQAVGFDEPAQDRRRAAMNWVLTGVGLGLPAAFRSKRLAATMVEHLAAGGIFPIVVCARGTRPSYAARLLPREPRS